MDISFPMDIRFSMMIPFAMVRFSVYVAFSMGLSMELPVMPGAGLVMKFSTSPMMMVMIFIPVILAPVMVMSPSPPIVMELTVVNPVISPRHTENIIRRDSKNGPRNQSWLDKSPGAVIGARPEPPVSMKPIPRAIVEIKTRRFRHQVDIAFLAGNDDHIGWCGKWYGRRRNTNVNVFRG
jgi:hypothetical protein